MRTLTNNLLMFESKTNVLLYILGKECYLIDSGKSSRLKKEMDDYIKKNHLTLKGIINTHCHSDHISNDDLFNTKIYASNKERTMIENYDLQMDVLFGGKHPHILDQGFLYSSSFKTNDLINIPGLKYIELPGHSYNMIGILINNKILYIGDALLSNEELCSIPYIYNIDNFIKSLNKLNEYSDYIIISSHIGRVDDINKTVGDNKQYLNNIIKLITEYCNINRTFDDIFKYLCYEKKITLNNVNYFLISSAIKSLLSYLVDNDIILLEFTDNLYYRKTL